MIINLSDEAKINLGAPPYDTEGLTCCVLGNKGSGKSNTLAVISEEFHLNQIPFVFYDPNGDACSLRQLGDDVIVVGDVNHHDPTRRAHYSLSVVLDDAKNFIGMVLNDGFSMIIDMTEQGEQEVHPLIVFAQLMSEHYKQAGRLRVPCGVLVDEAHAIAPQGKVQTLEGLSRRELRKVATDGRKRGMALVAATQRATYLDKAIIFGCNIRIFGKITYFPDYEVVKHYIPATFQQMKTLQSGEVFISSEKAFGKTKIRLRRTADLGATPAFSPVKRGGRPRLSDLQVNTGFMQLRFLSQKDEEGEE